jgi:carbon-monoxide dehydrogenase medium subunit
MIPQSFDYHAPTNVHDALGLLARYGNDVRLLAGGHSLLPMMKLRFAQPAHLIDLNRIGELRGIRDDNGTICIGAMTVERDLLASKLLAEKLPLLPEAVRQIADPQVRNRGTLGGDLAHGDPGNDHPAVAIALDAVFVIEGAKGRRQIKAEDFYHGLFMTDLAADEILVEIQAPVLPKGTGCAYEKLKRKVGDWATAAAAVVLRMDAGKVGGVRIALTNVAATPLRAVDAEQALLGRPLDDAALEDAMTKVEAICDPAEDLRGDAEYKTAMAGQMTRRALLKAAERCR